MESNWKEIENVRNKQMRWILQVLGERKKKSCRVKILLGRRRHPKARAIFDAANVGANKSQ